MKQPSQEQEGNSYATCLLLPFPNPSPNPDTNPIFTAGALLPGALVDAQVTNVVSDGLVLSFLTFFSGTVDQFHLPQVTSAKAKQRKEKQRKDKKREKQDKARKERKNSFRFSAIMSGAPRFYQKQPYASAKPSVPSAPLL